MKSRDPFGFYRFVIPTVFFTVFGACLILAGVLFDIINKSNMKPVFITYITLLFINWAVYTYKLFSMVPTFAPASSSDGKNTTPE